MNISVIKNVIGVIMIIHGLLCSVMFIGGITKFDHPENWAYNLGFRDIIIVIGDPVSPLYYYGFLAYSFVQFIGGLAIGYVILFKFNIIKEKLIKLQTHLTSR